MPPKAYFFPTSFVDLIRDIYYNLTKSTMEEQLHFLFLVAKTPAYYGNLAAKHVKSQKQNLIINFQRHTQSNLSLKEAGALPGQSAKHWHCWAKLVFSQEKHQALSIFFPSRQDGPQAPRYLCCLVTSVTGVLL